MSAAVLPKISVAIITYNQKAYLEEAIESVLAQDYENLEIVVADDGSSDGSHELLRKYEQQYPGQFKLELGDRNIGITGNSNRALFACTGKYVAWLGGDDIMLAGRLRQQSEYMESHPECAACFHDLDVFESVSGKTIGRFSDTYPIEEFNASALKTIVRYGFGGGPSAMVRSSMSPTGGFDERIPSASDWLYWIELARVGTMKYIPETLTRYRRHSTNATRNLSYLSEDMVRTLEIVDEKYPELKPETRYARARFAYSQGVQSVRAKEWVRARQHLNESISLSWLGWKWLLWYARAAIRK